MVVALRHMALARGVADMAKIHSANSLRARAPIRVRSLATHAAASPKKKPCSDYISMSHPDGDASAGSKIADTLDRYSHSVLATYSRPQLMFTRGSGLDLYAAADPNTNKGHNERKYLDFSSGIAVNSLGHSDPEIAQIAAEQSAKLVHASNLYHNEWSGELSDRMVKLTHQHGGLGFQAGSKPATSDAAGLKVFLANSGTEANEAALKFARKAAKIHPKGGDHKTGLVSFTNAFHGRTMGALAMTPNPKYQAPFAPLIGNVTTGTYNQLEGLDELINEHTAGVIVEPVQGEGGIYPANVEWLEALRKRCDEVGCMLIYDEIQCGLFRAGTLWCHSEYPVTAHPDMVTMAKPLANGFPIGAVLMRDSVANLIAVGDHGTTFGGGPLTSRIAHHVMGRLSSSELGASMKEASDALFSRLRGLVATFPDMLLDDPAQGKSSPRGKGLIVGFSTKDPSHAGKLVALARQRGLLILSAGNDTVRLLPSLIVTREQVDKAVDVIESCLLVLQEEAKRSASSSMSSTSSTSSSANQQARAFSTSAVSRAPAVSAEQVQGLYKEFVALGTSWPQDPLRPDLDFGKSIQSAAQAALHPESPIDSTPRQLTKEEFEYAETSFHMLKDMKDNRVQDKFALPESMLKPKSHPQYYERLLQGLEKAAQGESMNITFSDKLKRFFGRT